MTAAQIHAIALPREGRLRRAQRSGPTEAEDAVLQVLMVTDLVDSTQLLIRLGDVEALRVMRTHNRLVRDALQRHGGHEVTHTGDGVFASFRSVHLALICATEIHDSLATYSLAHPEAGMRVRIGVHIGEPLPEDGRLFGTCINTAVRICASAAPGCTMVSDLVRQVASGYPFAFVERGVFTLKGLHVPTLLHELGHGEAEPSGSSASDHGGRRAG